MSAIARGERVGGFELVEILGQGGMGTVWLAHPEGDPEQLYAVKTVSTQYLDDRRVVQMFVKEAGLAASIEHPNVVHLYDVGLHDNVPYFVMEWIDGFSLREVTKALGETDERVPAGIALRIASDVCAGLHAAHEARTEDGTLLGLVHRDVSPHNVLVTRDGIPKLIDFGVAKAVDMATGSEQSVVGGLKGKVRYMAPEQALEKEVDRRADLFSVGAIVYHLLTGRAPFEGPNDLAIMQLLTATSPVFVPDDLPEPVQWILRRSLARRPDQRFSTAAEMQAAIEEALHELEEPSSHADVAECLAWFVRPASPGPRAPNAVPAPRALAPTAVPQPPIAAVAPPAQPIAARRSFLDERELLVVDDADQRTRAAHVTAASWRFVLLGVAFVGLLGAGAALLVQQRPPKKAEVAAPPPSAPPPPPPMATPSTVPQGTSTTLPIIDFGDVDDHQAPPPAKAAKKRRGAASSSTPLRPPR